MTSGKRQGLPPRTLRMLRELEGPGFRESARGANSGERAFGGDAARPGGSFRGKSRTLAHALFAAGVLLVVVVGSLQTRASDSSDEARKFAGRAVPPHAPDIR